MASFFRAMVSKKKKRYQKDGFDLDLSYVTDRIIAMGFPSEGKETLYRNPMSEVVKFMNKYHKDKYMVYNLCSEKDYDIKHFDGRVVNCGFDDHQPPSVPQIKAFCESVSAWMFKHPQNVINVHCKAGKGRTGVMICSYLVLCGQHKSPSDALQFYAERRTKNGKGVTIASQRRYIHYFCRSLKSGDPPACPVVLQHLQVAIERDTDLVFAVYERTLNKSRHEMRLVCCSCPTKEAPLPTATVEVPQSKTGSFKLVPLNSALTITGDVKIEFYEKSVAKANLLMYTWFNTAFLPEDAPSHVLKLPRIELDKVRKSLSGEVSVAVHMRSAPSPAAGPRTSPAPAPTKLPHLPGPNLNPSLAATSGDQHFPRVSSSEAKDAGPLVGEASSAPECQPPPLPTGVQAKRGEGGGTERGGVRTGDDGGKGANQAVREESGREVVSSSNTFSLARTPPASNPEVPTPPRSSPLSQPDYEKVFGSLSHSLDRMQVLLEDLRQEEEVGNSMHRHLTMVLRRLDSHAASIETNLTSSAISNGATPQLASS